MSFLPAAAFKVPLLQALNPHLHPADIHLRTLEELKNDTDIHSGADAFQALRVFCTSEVSPAHHPNDAYGRLLKNGAL